MENPDIESIAGCALITIICAWAVVSLTKNAWCNFTKGTTVDRTLSDVTKEEAPGIFRVQTAGFVVLIACATLIGAAAIIGLLLEIAGAVQANG